MIDSPALLKDLKAQLKLLVADLLARAEDTGDAWGARLNEEYAEARKRERTGHSWPVWRDNEVDQAAVAWIIATTFLRFCEDNDLLVGAYLNGRPTPIGWITGPGNRTALAEENLTAYFRANPAHNRRHWLQQGFAVLAAQPAGKALVDPDHNPVWTALISPESATALIAFWRRTDDDGSLIHDFNDPELSTRFLGDLYQDLSDHAQETYALLQTPEFVEDFVLGKTLSPAIKEFGHEELKVIDPACGSGHFLLGAFERIILEWRRSHPAVNDKDLVRKAMASIHGVDVNPFAVAIARFRLTVAGLKNMGESSISAVEPLGFSLAIGDSLLGEQGGAPATLDDREENFKADSKWSHYDDLADYVGILQPGQYHVVVGNPPYITTKDPALLPLYRRAYKTAYREFQLTAPFMELMFRLAIRGSRGQSAGYVGQITGNGFMRHEFGRKVVEELFGGHYVDNPVELSSVIDAAGVHIPGHGTPTVLIFGRRRVSAAGSIPVTLACRAEAREDGSESRSAWTEILEHGSSVGYRGAHISVVELERSDLAVFPWPLFEADKAELMFRLSEVRHQFLAEKVEVFGYTGQTNSDGAFLAPMTALQRRQVGAAFRRNFVTGEDVRDYLATPRLAAIFPYSSEGLVDAEEDRGLYRWMWPLRTSTWSRATFSKKTYRQEKRTWWEWHQIALDRIGRWSISYPQVETIQHFALVRSAPVFNRHASFLQLATGSDEDQYLGLLGTLNSSVVAFWLKQVCHNKGEGGGARVDAGYAAMGEEEWRNSYEFTGTKLKLLPLAHGAPIEIGRKMDALARELVNSAPDRVVSEWLSNGACSPLSLQTDAAALYWSRLRLQMIFWQEELDWKVYQLYGLADSSTTFQADSLETLELGQRSFEIALARRVESGSEQTKWFLRHGSTPTASMPESWPAEYSGVVSKRLDLIDTDPAIGLLERPEFKRQWDVVPWSVQLADALGGAILYRLERAALWSDEQGPQTRSVAELADQLRVDSVLRELAAVLTGSAEPDLSAVLGSLMGGEAVPYLAAHRYTPSGLERFRTWQAVWDLQRREDAGETIDISVPPKYSKSDFRKSAGGKDAYWKARGKLDVPKERFILYPDLRREADSTPVLGWAGWDHRDQALALGRELPVQESLGADDEALTPLVAGLVELEPWLHQWHAEEDPAFGASPAAVITQVIDQYLLRMEKTRDDVTAWTPPAPTRGRRQKRS